MPSTQLKAAILLTLACAGCNADKPEPDMAPAQEPSAKDPEKAKAAVAAAHEIAQGKADPHHAMGHPQMPPGHPATASGQKTPAGDALPDNSAGGLTWKVQTPLVAQRPGSSMRAAEYQVEGDGDAEAAVLTVFYFGAGQGGSIQANVDRWVGQFSQPDGRDSKAVAKLEDQEVSGFKVKRLDLIGTFADSMGPMMQAKAEPKANYRLLGAIVDGPKGPVFFKLVGPSATVEKAEGAFDSLVNSLRTSSP